MARISSSVGLVTGLNIQDTVKQLMAVAGRPRDMLKTRTDDLKQEQIAFDTLGSKLLSFQFAANKLKAGSVFNTRAATSSNEDVLKVSIPAGGTPSVGSFQVRPVQAASAQQLVSQVFQGTDASLGSGTFSFGFGGFLDQGISLDQLNEGAGIQRGKIRITDRSGVTAVIDLSFARNVDDVLAAINENSDIAVTATTDGDSFVLTDASGGSGTLKVAESAGGTTAAGLGLAGISVAANTATGADVLRLHAGTKLASLNDGNGVTINKLGVVDLDVHLADGSALGIDLHDAETLGDVITQINTAGAGKITAAIAGDGNRLVLTDLTTGASGFSVGNGSTGTAADDLGVAGAASGASITGKRLISGLRDTLLTSLKGGQGIGTLGLLQVTDRAGVSANVNLASAETLDDVVDLINAAAPNVTAAINSARNGLSITDDTVGVGNLIIANGDATNSADKLGLTVNQSAATKSSGALKRQTISEATLLSSLNGGKGVVFGDVRITDSKGVSKTADLNTSGLEPKTVGDVLDAINALSNGVEARINDAGDGVILTDTAAGTGTLGVKDLSGDIAKSLNLTRASKTIDVGGTPTQVIDGANSYTIDLSNLQSSSSAVLLSSLNGGKGIGAGDVRITDATGKALALDLNGSDAGITTVGQLIDAINDKATAGGVGVVARLNSAKTGIELEDTSGGGGKLTVEDVGAGTAAKDLKILGEATKIGGKQIINGAGAFAAASGTQTGLSALADSINGLKAGVTASTVFDGTGYRLTLAVDATGAANQLLIDSGTSDLDFEQTAKAQDAVILYGNSSTPGGGVLVSSQTNTFTGTVGGVNLTVAGASDAAITVSVSQTDESLVSTVEDFVESYNSLRDDLDKLTAFDDKALTTGLLFGTNEALQIDTRLGRALTDRYAGLGDLQSLEQIGLSLSEDGKLELNKTKLKSAFEADPAGVQNFLSNAQSGVAVKISKVVDGLAGDENSLIASSSGALQDTIESNETRLDQFETQLKAQEERLLAQFYQLETIIAKLKQSQSALDGLQPLAPYTGVSG
ncbi:flagellar filament capping protein FliD [Lacipirellula limnantheis]|uniref:Filament cap protein n=1 Tax=Lacipirellula limnantheis TaxID=2528024 RepID=A0A517TV76_9BACT|nr:flagellar filament capping protein FliD [Lacipirellula limnantheis]QDT72280.1 Flagellar hook-associated protein 2 [Lacipirellula limnantheis]